MKEYAIVDMFTLAVKATFIASSILNASTFAASRGFSEQDGYTVLALEDLF